MDGTLNDTSIAGFKTLLGLDQAVLDAIPVALHVCGPRGEVVRFNRRAIELLGPQSGRLDFHDGNGGALAFGNSPLAIVLKTGAPVRDVELSLVKDNGSRLVVLVNIEPLRGEDGEVEGALSCFKDITKRKRTEDLLRESEHRVRELLDALPAGVYTTDADGVITFFNRATVEMAGREPQLGNDRWCPSWKLYGTDGNILPHDRCPMATTLKEQRPVRQVEITVARPDGSQAQVMPFPTPLHDASGQFVGAVNMLIDITELKKAQEAVVRRVHEQTALFEFTNRLYRADSAGDVYDAALDAIAKAMHCDRASVLIAGDDNVLRFVAWRGLSESYRKAVEGHSPWTPDIRDPQPIWVDDVTASDLPADLKATVLKEGIRACAFIPLVSKGRLIGKFMTYFEKPHRFTGEEIGLGLTIARQLVFSIERTSSEEARRQAEEQRTLLINELNHRVKNTLATVQSLASQTMRSTERSADARDLFESRLAALSRAHDLLTQQNWEGADLRDVIERALEPFQTDDRRCSMSGPYVRLSPRQTLAISLALHELATNAAKYGALSSDHGQVGVSWGVEAGEGGREARITWAETGGPPVEKPKKTGFGTRLIQRSLASDLGAAADVDYRPDGVVALFRTPVEYPAARH